MLLPAALVMVSLNFAPPGAGVHGDTVPSAPQVVSSPSDTTPPAALVAASPRDTAMPPVALIAEPFRDTTLAPASAAAPRASGVSPRLLAASAPLDTPRARPRAVEVSDWYGRRLTIHRYLSYSVIPLFAVQYVAGRRLYDESADAPGWVKTTHRTVATTLAGVFAVNTVTGLWNLWDSRSTPEGRVLRTAHALTMLAADAGFTYAGAKLSREAETSLVKRRQHRDLALGSMGLTLAGGLMMKIWNH